MKQWRPKGWEYGAWRKDELLLRNPPVYINERLYNAFEAGADAMLEALKLHCGKYVADYEIPWVSKNGHYSGVQLRDGWLIFIPASGGLFPSVGRFQPCRLL